MPNYISRVFKGFYYTQLGGAPCNVCFLFLITFGVFFSGFSHPIVYYTLDMGTLQQNYLKEGILGIC